MQRWLLPTFLLLGVLLPAQTVLDGRLDLQKWDGATVTTLDGNWRFWANSLPDSGPGSLLAVPGSWNPVMGTTDGWGVYRLTVVLPDPAPRRLALWIPLINSSSEVVWNGTSVWKLGDWNPQSYQPGRRTGVVEMEARPGENTLEIRVGSWGDYNAGLIESLKVGDFAELSTERYTDISLQTFLFGCLFIMGVYHLGLFLYRREDLGPIWFGVFSIILAMRCVVYGTGYLADIAPWMSWDLSTRIGYITFSGGTLFFCLFIGELFPQVTPRWFRPLALVGAGGYALMNIVLPSAWYTPALTVFQPFVGVIGLLICYILARAALSKLTGAWLFLAGFLLFFSTVVSDILKTNLYLPIPNLSPVGLLSFLVFQSMVMLRKFTVAFADSERYSQHLSRINVSLERFIPREILSYLNKDSILDIELGDYTEQPMVVMFADIRDFTTLSETMSPKENFQFINSYLRRMGPVVRRHNGFVDKYMGDGIMALFPENAEDALQAALDMRKALEEYNEHRMLSGYPPIRMGIGLHRGPLMLGTIGENRRMDSTVISDTVNTASRLEGLTKKFSRDILVSEETVEALGADFSANLKFEFLAEETVKGRHKTLRVYSMTSAV